MKSLINIMRPIGGTNLATHQSCTVHMIVRTHLRMHLTAICRITLPTGSKLELKIISRPCQSTYIWIQKTRIAFYLSTFLKNMKSQDHSMKLHLEEILATCRCFITDLMTMKFSTLIDLLANQ
jgi:hypothetical protein